MNKRNQRHAKLFYTKNAVYNDRDNHDPERTGKGIEAGQLVAENLQRKNIKKETNNDHVESSKDRSFEDSQLKKILGSELGEDEAEFESYLVLDVSKQRQSRQDNSIIGLLERRHSLSSVSSSFYHDIYHPKFSNFLNTENSERSCKEFRKETFMDSFSSRKEPFDFQSFMATIPSEVKRNIHFDHQYIDQDFSAKKHYEELLKAQLFEKLNNENESHRKFAVPEASKKGMKKSIYMNKLE